jgi:hypothetical protein
MVLEKIPRKSLSTTGIIGHTERNLSPLGSRVIEMDSFRHGSLRARSLKRLDRLLDELALKAVVSLKVVSSSLEYQLFEVSFHKDSVMSSLSATNFFLSQDLPEKLLVARLGVNVGINDRI